MAKLFEIHVDDKVVETFVRDNVKEARYAFRAKFFKYSHLGHVTNWWVQKSGVKSKIY